MNREINFRGLDYDGNWVYGDLIHGVGYKRGNIYILPLNENLAYIPNCDPLDGVKVIPESIGQFIGFCDKNNKPVYEEDIVIFRFNEIYIKGKVIFKDSAFQIEYGDKFKIYQRIYSWNNVHIEVIGNIYDNPELLEK